MKQLLDKLNQVIMKKKNVIIFVVGIVLIAFITGCIFTTILSFDDKVLVKNYISEFINKIDNNELNYFVSFKNSFISNLIFLITIWVLGLSVVGIPINLFIYFAKSFILGFSMSSFILKYKVKGCMLGLLYIFPHQIINLIIYTFLLLFSMNFSKRIIISLKSKKNISFNNSFKRYVFMLLLSIFIVFITSLLEILLTPFLIDKILFIVK